MRIAVTDYYWPAYA